MLDNQKEKINRMLSFISPQSAQRPRRDAVEYFLKFMVSQLYNFFFVLSVFSVVILIFMMLFDKSSYYK